MANTLETLLSQIRDGTAGPADLERARVLVQVDERIPPDLRDEVLRDPADAEADAVGLLAILGVEDSLFGDIAAAVHEESGLFVPGAFEPIEVDLSLDDAWEPLGRALSEGLVAEADGVEIADIVMRRLPITGFAWGPVLVDAVAHEAGPSDVADDVFVTLGLAESAPVASAIAAEAGEIDIVGAVMAALAAELPLVVSPVAEAVRAEAGTVNVVPAVMGIVVPDPARLPRPANDNRGWAFGAVVLAATALLAIAVGRLATPLSGVVDAGLLFARAGDVVVEDLSYADNVQVFQTEGDQGAVILWLDEEA